MFLPHPAPRNVILESVVDALSGCSLLVNRCSIFAHLLHMFSASIFKEDASFIYKSFCSINYI